MRRWQSIPRTALAAGMSLSLFASVPVFGAVNTGPGAVQQETRTDAEPKEVLYEAVDGSSFSMAELSDGIVHYEELGSLIHAFNTDIRDLVDTAEKNRQKYTEMRDYLISEQSSLREEIRSAESMEDLVELSTIKATYASAIHNYNRQLKRLDSYGGNKNRIARERSLTIMAQNLMISLKSAMIQEEIMETMEAMQAENLKNARLRLSVGSVTENDVLAAENSFLSAQANHISASAGRESLYHQLCRTLGLEENGSIQFAEISHADRSFLSTVDFENDVQQAIHNNASYMNYRQSTGSKTSADAELKELTSAEKEGQIRMEMEGLYASLRQADQDLKAAENAWEAAKIRWNTAELQYSMGSLSLAQYLAQKLTYLQKAGTCQSAELNYLKAIETYKWAVKGQT